MIIFGQLCLGNTTNQSTPQQTPFSNIVRIAASDNSLFQNHKGDIYGCGSTTYGQLGIRSKRPQIKAIKLGNQPPNIIQFCSGVQHSLFLDSAGNVFSIGKNINGSLGIGKCEYQKNFNKIPNIPPIQAISCIGNSSYLIDVDGNLWCFGYNEYFQLGFGDNIDRMIPTKKERVCQIASGCCGNHFLAKNHDNQIFGVGANDVGQLGTGETTSKQENFQEINSDYATMWGKSQSIQNRTKSARK